MRQPLWWFFGVLCALTLVSAPPSPGCTEQEGRTALSCCQESALAAPSTEHAGVQTMSASALQSGVTRVQGEERPRLPDLYHTQHFTLFYTDDPESPHAPALDDENRNRVPDYIEGLAEYFERAWTVYTSEPPAGLGFQPPPMSGPRYPVLVYQLPAGYSGQTWADNRSGRRATSHASMSASLSEPYVRAVAAHELFHAIQYGYNYQASFWWKEASAEWAAAEVFPDVDTYVIPYYDWFQVPSWSLDYADGWHEYGSSLWVKHLAQTRGRDIIRQIWLNQRNENDSLKATAAALEAIGTTLALQFHEFTVWNWFTGERADGAHYLQGELYPMLSPPDQPPGLFVPMAGALRKLSSHYMSLVPPGGTPVLPRGLTIRLKNDEGVAAQLILERTDGTRSVVLVNAPRYHIPDFERSYRRVTLVLSNGDTATARRYAGSTSLGLVFRDQYGYLWDLQVNFNGVVHGTVDVGGEQPWDVTGAITDQAFRCRAVNPDGDKDRRWATGFDVEGTISEEGVPQLIGWSSDSGRSDKWEGGVVDGSIPARGRVDRRGPAQR